MLRADDMAPPIWLVTPDMPPAKRLLACLDSVVRALELIASGAKFGNGILSLPISLAVAAFSVALLTVPA